MDSAIRQLIEALHRAPCKYALALTGGGTGAAAMLLNVPGGSRTVLEVVVPYHEQALADYLGHRPEQYCSAATSRALAVRARERARWLCPGEAVAGVGCTASLATDRPKRGDHRFHVAVATGDGTTTSSVILCKDARDRQGEEAVLDMVLLNALAAALGVSESVEPSLLPGEVVQLDTTRQADPLSALLRGQVSAIQVTYDGCFQTAGSTRPAVLLPGSFNPTHEGHWRLAATAGRIGGAPVAFELSVSNADKPTLSIEEVRWRLGQFQWRAPVWLTRAPTFVEKARLFPNALFVVGADTAARIVAARYYQDSETAMSEALAVIRAQGCRFLVAGRCDAAGKFVELQTLHVPEHCLDLFTAIPESAFCLDVSSTQLRQQA